MNLVPIIYTTLLIIAFIAFILILGSYVLYKMKKNVKDEKQINENKKDALTAVVSSKTEAKPTSQEFG